MSLSLSSKRRTASGQEGPCSVLPPEGGARSEQGSAKWVRWCGGPADVGRRLAPRAICGRGPVHAGRSPQGPGAPCGEGGSVLMASILDNSAKVKAAREATQRLLDASSDEDDDDCLFSDDEDEDDDDDEDDEDDGMGGAGRGGGRESGKRRHTSRADGETGEAAGGGAKKRKTGADVISLASSSSDDEDDDLNDVSLSLEDQERLEQEMNSMKNSDHQLIRRAYAAKNLNNCDDILVLDESDHGDDAEDSEQDADALQAKIEARLRNRRKDVVDHIQNGEYVTIDDTPEKTPGSAKLAAGRGSGGVKKDQDTVKFLVKGGAVGKRGTTITIGIDEHFTALASKIREHLQDPGAAVDLRLDNEKIAMRSTVRQQFKKYDYLEDWEDDKDESIQIQLVGS